MDLSDKNILNSEQSVLKLQFMINRDFKVSGPIWDFSEYQILLDIEKLFLLVRWTLAKQMSISLSVITGCFYKEYFSFRTIWKFQTIFNRNLMLTVSIFLFVQRLHTFLHLWIHQKFSLLFRRVFKSLLIFVTFINDFSTEDQDGIASTTQTKYGVSDSISYVAAVNTSVFTNLVKKVDKSGHFRK